MPAILSNGAQLLLACSLGTQFRQSFLREAPRFVAAQLAAVALILAVSVGIGVALSWVSGAYLGSTLLAAAPGAIAEMSITAKVLHVGVPFVTAAHVMRYLVVVVFSGPTFRFLAARMRP
jgi:membrane AbrB-like protein